MRCLGFYLSRRFGLLALSVSIILFLAGFYFLSTSSSGAARQPVVSYHAYDRLQGLRRMHDSVNESVTKTPQQTRRQSESTTSSNYTSIDFEHVCHATLSQLYRKLHVLEDRLWEENIRQARSARERGIVGDYERTKQIISINLKKCRTSSSDQEELRVVQSDVQSDVESKADVQKAKVAVSQSQLTALAMRRARIMLCSFSLVDQMNMNSVHNSLSSRPKRDLIIIVANMRTGSSFFGQIFEKSDDVLYFYEPLKGISRLAVSQNFSKSDTQKLNLALLKSISTCNFETKIGHQFLQDISLSTYSARANSHVLASPPLCPSDCPEMNRCPVIQSHIFHRVCMSKQATVVKSIRIPDIMLLRELVNIETKGIILGHEKPAKLQVAHLVRDPRAVLFSRMRIRGQLEKDFLAIHGKTAKIPSRDLLIDSEARSLCTEMWTNLHYADSHPNWLKDRYHIFKFEDIALKPQLAAKKLYNLYGLQMSNSVLEWIEQNTHAATNRGNPFGTNRDSELVVTAWKTLLRAPIGRHYIQIMQSRCQHVMKFLGYELENKELFRAHVN